MQKEVSRIPWISIALVFVAIVTVGIFTQPSFDPTGALVYRDYSYGGYSGSYGGGYLGSFGYGQMTITEFYQTYSLYIDAIIFLIIFLSIGKAVFLDHFKTGGKTLYVALGLGLTLALMLWEEQQGISIIYEAGVVSVIVIVLALLAGTYFGIKKATGSSWWSFFAAVAVGFILHLTFDLFGFIFNSQTYSNLSTKLEIATQTPQGQFSIAMVIGVLVILFILGKKAKDRWLPN